jgi:hypothetical protein
MYPLRHYGPVMDAVLVDESDPTDPGRKRKRFFNQIFAAHRGWTDDLNKPGQSVVFGDGTEMPWEAMAMMARVFEEESVVVPWCVGDVLLIDNLHVMHSRLKSGAGFANGVVPRRALSGEETGAGARRRETRRRRRARRVSDLAGQQTERRETRRPRSALRSGAFRLRREVARTRVVASRRTNRV